MKTIKYILVFFLCSGFVIPHEVKVHLFQLPAVVEHFRHHLSEHKTTRWIDFLSFHNTDENHHEKSHHEHGQLPLSHHHHAECIQIILLFDPSEFTSFTVENTNGNDVLFLNYTDNFYFEYLPSIWQPPRTTSFLS